MKIQIKTTHHPGREHAVQVLSREMEATADEIAELKLFIMNVLNKRRALSVELPYGSELILGPEVAQLSAFEIMELSE